MPPPSQLTKLNLQVLEPRDVPALWAIQLDSPASGFAGDTAASISGLLSLNSNWPTDDSGRVLVDADTEQEAVALALGGTITAQVGNSTFSYVFDAATIGSSPSAHAPFLIIDGVIYFEDMAGSAASDWDYNDRIWIVTATPKPSNDPTTGDGTTPPPQSPPTTPPTSPPTPPPNSPPTNFPPNSPPTIPPTPPPNLPPTTPGTPTVWITPYANATEGGANGGFTIARSKSVGALTVTYNLSGTATLGADYTGLTGSVTLADGIGAVGLPFVALNDNIVEETESVITNLTSAPGYTITIGTATAWIYDFSLTGGGTGGGVNSPPTVPPVPDPPLFSVQLITDEKGNVENSPGTIFAGRLLLNQSFASIGGGGQRIAVDAVDEKDAVRKGLIGTIYSRLTADGRAMEHIYRSTLDDATNTVGRDIPTSTLKHWSYYVEALATPTATGANYRVHLEDMNGPNPIGAVDNDYNDRYWDLKVTAIPKQAVKLEIVDGSGSTGLSSLKVGKWENAFKAPAQPKGLPTLKNNFLQLDPDRFRIRVTDTASITNDTKGFESRMVTVVTSSDTGNTVTVSELIANSGVFYSNDLLLVSNRSDDEYRVDDVQDNRPNDRTFVVKLGDDISFNYANLVEKRETAPVLKYVDVNVTVLREKPATGTNPLAADKFADETRGYLTKIQTQLLLDFANEQFAQIGLQLRFKNGVQFSEQPANVDLNDGLNIGMKSLQGEMVDEQRALFSGIPTRTADTRDVELIFVNALFPWSFVSNEWKLGNEIAGVAISEAIAPRNGNVADTTVADTIAVGTGETIDIYTVAHEMVHILTQLAHVRRAVPNGETYDYEVPVAAVNLVSSGDATNETADLAEESVLDGKRLVSSQARRIELRQNLLKKY